MTAIGAARWVASHPGVARAAELVGAGRAKGARPAKSAENGDFRRLMGEAENRVFAGGREETGRAQTDPAALRELREAAIQFEAYFLRYLIKGMRQTVPDGGLIDTGFAGEVYEEMYDQSLSETMAGAGGIGLAELLVDQLAGQVTGEDDRIAGQLTGRIAGPVVDRTVRRTA